MRIIIISSLSLISQVVFSQQQQQQVVLTNVNFSNLNNRSRNVQQNDNSFNNASNFNVMLNNNISHRQQTVKNTVKVSPSKKFTQVKTANTIKGPIQVRHRSNHRPRPVAQVNDPAEQVLTASNSNPAIINNLFVDPPAQDFVLINNEDIQIQNTANISQENNINYQQDNSNSGAQINFNSDLSLNLKGSSVVRKMSYGSGSSSKYRSHMFSKKFAKFKRHFFGKISSHKKSKHRLDVCFNWKN